MDRLPTFLSLPFVEKKCFLEAVILIIVFRVCVRTFPYKYIARALEALWRGHSSRKLDSHPDVGLVKVSLRRAEGVFRSPRLCLPMSMAAFVMLQRRGIPALVILGVRRSSSEGMMAHAWIEIQSKSYFAAEDIAEFTPVGKIG